MNAARLARCREQEAISVAKKPGPKKQPAEKQKRRGNPSHRALPDGTTSLAPTTTPGEIPEPLRPLAASGRAEWDTIWTRAWTWLGGADLLAVQRYCEAVDDYVIVRSSMLAAQADERVSETQRWRLRKHARDATKLCDDLAAVLGIGPAYRTNLDVGLVSVAESLAGLLDREPAARMTAAFVDVDSTDA
jgi:hypothetical protein